MPEHIKLKHLLILALVVRLIAVFFSKGYGWSDDHYEVIEIAHSWVNGWNYWLNEGRPSVHSIVYPGFNYLIFEFCEKVLFLTDGQDKMLVNRLVHALFSLFTVYYGYKITEKIAPKDGIPTKVGVVLAMLWLFPFLSVRNLIEWFCVPFCMASFYYMLRAEEEAEKSQNIHRNYWLFWGLSGLLVGSAFSIRLMVLIFAGGVGLVLLARRQILTAAVYGFSVLAGMFLVQGVTDWIFWGNPLGSTRAFFEYNLTQHGVYPQNHVLTFTLVLAGIALPPAGLLILFGFFYSARKHLLLFAPAVAFLIFHSIFPNRQERFIFPMLPLFFILGITGWETFRKKSSFWLKNRKLNRIFFKTWSFVNFILLLFLSTHYGKKTLCEPWTFIAKRNDVKEIWIHLPEGRTLSPQQFYSNNRKRMSQPTVYLSDSPEKLLKLKESLPPNYVIIFSNEKFSERLAQMKACFPDLKVVQTIEPAFIDRLAYQINPVTNLNFQAVICTIGTPMYESR